MFTPKYERSPNKVCNKLLRAQRLGCHSSASVDAAGCLEEWLLSKYLVVFHTVCMYVALWLAFSFCIYACFVCMYICTPVACLRGQK